ncbi:hypothetical protein N9T44_00985 [Candidatus Pelagibacter sp.]|nr:hypothetical protein [Candidatus Pelagibacter sp.]
MPAKSANLNFFTTSFGLPTCLNISIDFPYPTIETFGKFEFSIFNTFFGFSLVGGFTGHSQQGRE